MKRDRVLALLAALALALAGVAWTGCGDDDSGTTDESIERTTDEAQNEGEEALDDAQREVEESADEAQKKAKEAGDEAEKRLDEAKKEGEEKLDEAKEEIERYAP